MAAHLVAGNMQQPFGARLKDGVRVESSPVLSAVKKSAKSFQVKT